MCLVKILSVGSAAPSLGSGNMGWGPLLGRGSGSFDLIAALFKYWLPQNGTGTLWRHKPNGNTLAPQASPLTIPSPMAQKGLSCSTASNCIHVAEKTVSMERHPRRKLEGTQMPTSLLSSLTEWCLAAYHDVMKPVSH